MVCCRVNFTCTFTHAGHVKSDDADKKGIPWSSILGVGRGAELSIVKITLLLRSLVMDAGIHFGLNRREIEEGEDLS